jgi:hypothetical protein
MKYFTEKIGAATGKIFIKKLCNGGKDTLSNYY